MSTLIASLYASITGDSSGLKNALSGAKTSMQNTAKEMTTFGGGIKDTIMKFGGLALGAGAAYKAVSSVGDFFKSSVGDTIDYAKAVRDVSRYTGMTADQSSIMLQIADDLQIEMGSLKMGFRNLNKEGIQPNIENIKALAVEYQAIVDPVEKAQFATEKFGARAGQELSKMLELTAEEIDNVAQSAQDLGLVLDSTAIQATEDYRLAVDELNDAYKGLKTTVGMAVIPALGDVAEGAGDFVTAFRLAQKATENGKYSMVDFFTTWMRMSSQAEIDQYMNDLRDAAGTAATAFADDRRESILAAEAIRGFADQIDTTQKILDPLQVALWDLSGAFDANGAAVNLLTQGYKAFATGLADLEMMKLNQKKITEGLTEEEYAAGVAKVYELSKLEMLNRGIETGIVDRNEYTRATQDGIISVNEINDAYEGLAAHGLGAVASNSEIAQSGIKDFGSAATTAGNAAAVAVEGVTGSIEGIAGSANGAIGAIDGIGAAINSLPKETVLTVKVNYITTGTGGGTWKTGGGMFEERALGGPVWSGHTYVVGESGPELFTPDISGKIIPNKQAGGMGGGGNITIHNHSAGAAALTMAIIAQSNRARLGRSMGG